LQGRFAFHLFAPFALARFLRALPGSGAFCSFFFFAPLLGLAFCFSSRRAFAELERLFFGFR
jgi:hypothetical protein